MISNHQMCLPFSWPPQEALWWSAGLLPQWNLLTFGCSAPESRWSIRGSEGPGGSQTVHSFLQDFSLLLVDKEIGLPGCPTRGSGRETSQDLLCHFLNQFQSVTPSWWGKAVLWPKRKTAYHLIFGGCSKTDHQIPNRKNSYAPNFIQKKPELSFELAITYSMPSSGLFVNASFE